MVTISRGAAPGPPIIISLVAGCWLLDGWRMMRFWRMRICSHRKPKKEQEEANSTNKLMIHDQDSPFDNH
eukprot:scaffold1222_cov260-Chaetoceros_neogracile.AAC.55